MPRTPGSLNQTTIEKIERMLAGDASISIPRKVMEIYETNYAGKNVSTPQPGAPNTRALEDAIEMKVVPEQNSQIANPMDDVIPNGGDDKAPWEEGKPKPLYTHEVYLKMYAAGILKQGDDPYLDKILETMDLPTPSEEPNNEDHEDVFLQSAGMTQGQVKEWAEMPSRVSAEQVDSVKEMAGSAKIQDEINENLDENEQLNSTSLGNAPRDANAQVPASVGDIPMKVGKMRVAKNVKIADATSSHHQKDDVDVPVYGSREWTSFILSQLMPKTEVVEKDGNVLPKCAGLKRMVETYIGPIIQAEQAIIASPTRDNCGLWAVQAKVTVDVVNPNHPIMRTTAASKILTWTDAANAFSSMDGQSDIVTLHPIPSAYTAALSRCFKAILCLSGVYASEEMENRGKPQKPHNPDNNPSMQRDDVKISSKQIHMIETLCGNIVDPVLLARDVCNDQTINSLEQLSCAEARAVHKRANEYQSNPNIPTHLS